MRRGFGQPTELRGNVVPPWVGRVHGDDCPGFAEELKEKGYDAIAPKEGEVFEV